jgi:hypothetical protein
MRYKCWIQAWIGIVLGACLLPANAGAPSASVSYQIRTAAGVRAHVITADLRNPAVMVKPVLAYNTPGRGQSFIRFMARHQPLAQISGGYFSVANWLPIGDIVIDGKLRYRGQVGSALTIRTDNTAEIVDIPRGWTYSWPGCESVLRGGVRLLRHGAYAAYPRQQGFRDAGLFRLTSRTAVGITPQRRLLMVATGRNISLSTLACLMKGLGCTDAMSLDGGTSTGLAYGSRVIIAPGRMLSNVLIITERPEPPPTPIVMETPAPPTPPE